uniref:Zinc-hook domain-containing protein n=1 Tax=Caenorhabditis tropicalis TaxID=1561998 RepID=A0A1I7TP81_9PELO
MAKFLRLHIRGIRSVGDEDQHVHKIEFLSPCTLISGPNGTGKTTTIEALNFVTTGQMPVMKKQAFIHSTEVARKTRVDASVTLEFVDVKGRVCTAVRRIALTTGTKASAQSEEHTLAIRHADGTTHTLSSKVCDFNKAILLHLGVPKAIFKYVIFCHQEESTWPLSEPKELKRRFDDIFQLTKFVKAQERMKKMVGDFAKNKETQESNKKLYEMLVKEKLAAKQSYDEYSKRITKGKELQKRLKEQKSQNFKQIEELRTNITKLEDTLTAIKLNEVERNNLKKQLSLIRVDPYSGTEEELHQQIEEIRNSEGRSYSEERTKIDRKIAKNNQEKIELCRLKTDLENKISSLKAEAIHRESLKYDLQQLESTLKSELELEDDAALDIEIDHAIRSKIQLMTKGTQSIVQTCDKLQSDLRSAQENATKIEVEVKSVQMEKAKLEKEVEQLKLKIKQGKNATSGMKDLLKKEEALRRSLGELPETDEDALRQCKLKRDKLLKELDSLKKKCSEAEKNAEQEKERESLQKTVTIAKKKITAYERKHEKNWKGLLGMVPEFPWGPTLTKSITKVRNDKKTMEEDLRDVQLNVQKLETMEQQYKKQEEALIVQELQLNEDIFDSCSCEPTEVSGKLTNVRKLLKKARKDLAPISAKADLYDSYIEESKTSGCCPLCDRDFSTKKEISEFSKRLQNMTLNFPAEQKELEKNVSKWEAEETKLMKAEAQAKELDKIVKDLKEIRQKNTSNSQEMGDEKMNLTTSQEKLDILNTKLKFAEELQADVGLIQQLCEQTDDQEQRLESLMAETQFSEGPSYSELRGKCEEKEKEYRRIVQESEELQKSSEERNRLQSKLNELGTHRVSLGETAAQAGAFAEQLEKKEKEIEKFEKKEFDQKQQQWKALTRSVLESGNSERALIEQEENARSLNKRIEENQQRQKRYEDDIRSFESIHQKEMILKDQLTRLKIEKKLQEIQKKLESFEGEVDEEQIREMKQEMNQLQNEQRSFGNEEVKIYTQMEEYEKQQAVAGERLAKKDIKNAEFNYRDAIIEVELLKESIQDLNKYRKCLDSSLIKFHTEKMAAVNVIIDELWRKVYNSTDITTIRIRSDSSGEASSKRTTYDYNVMMVYENGSEVEMRGRCSAGQKMLASLLIRIALAEVFGGLCSMIALDEPTTNLDAYKVDGMATVLSDLIAARRGVDSEGNLRGREMQMVVITHDERLVNKITLDCRPEYIYCLGKDEHGVSHLSKRFPDGTEKRISGLQRR